MSPAVSDQVTFGDQLTLPAPRPGVTGDATIRGRLLRADGRPLPRAEVRVVRVDVPAPRRRVDSDENGAYEFANLAAGRYTLTASKVGYLTQEYGKRRASGRGEPVTVAAAEVRERVDIVLASAGVVAGRILDEYGEPVEGAIVRLLQTGFSRGRRQLTEVAGVLSRRTNDLGRYRIFGVQPGRYLVSASVGQVSAAQNPADLPGYAVTYYPGTLNPSEARFVAVGVSPDTANIDFGLTRVPTARITGTATNSAGEPITGGLTLAPSHRSGAVFAASVGARIAADGSFEFPNLAPGEYVVQAAKSRVQTSVEGEFASQLVTVNGADVTGIVLRTSPGSRIAGRFSFEGADPPRAATIDLSPVPSDFDSTPLGGGFMATAEIHDDWTFDMAGINGPRRLRLTRAPPGWSLKSIVLHGTDITDTPLMFGTQEQSISGVEVLLTNTETVVSGSVTDGRAKLAPGSHVIVFASDRDRW
jgi:hypothetical protein